MKYGLSKEQLTEIVDFISHYPEVEKAVLFGSRAIDTFKEASDIDIAIFGQKANFSLAAKLKFDIEEDTYLPFMFDFVAYPTITNDALRKHINTKGVVIFRRGESEWRECKLGDVVTFQRGFDITQKKQVSGKYPVVSSSGIKSFHNEFKVNGPGVVIGRKGTLGSVFYIDSKYWPHDTSLWVKNFHENYPKFIFYFVKELDLGQYDVGSSNPTLNRNHIHQLPILIPRLEEQKAIASVLSSIDDKIDLLHRQNKTLEAMAETLFRQWFMEEAQEKWEEGVLSDEFDFIMGQSPPGSSFSEEGIGMPMFQGNADFGFRFPSQRVYTTEPTRLAQVNDTLISVRAPVGAQNMANTECCIGRGVAAFRYKHNNDYYTYTYFKLRSLMREITMFNDEGTVFGSISKTDFEKIATMIPPASSIDNFEEAVSPINDKVIVNCGQIKSLETLRDTLLPKLMSGEVRVAV